MKQNNASYLQTSFLLLSLSAQPCTRAWSSSRDTFTLKALANNSNTNIRNRDVTDKSPVKLTCQTRLKKPVLVIRGGGGGRFVTSVNSLLENELILQNYIII